MMNSKQWLKGCNAVVTGFAIAAAALVGACATDDATDQGADEPIAKLALADGSVVTFSEPSPGMIVVDQEGPRGFTPVAGSRQSAVELYTALAPGKAPPAALVAAQARHDEGREVTKGAAAAPVIHPSLDNAAFTSAFCVGDWSFVLCRPDLMTSISQSFGSTDEAIYTLCSDVGTVTLKVTWDGSPLFTHDVAQGQCFQKHVTTSIFSAPPSTFSATRTTKADRYDLSVNINF